MTTQNHFLKELEEFEQRIHSLRILLTGKKEINRKINTCNVEEKITRKRESYIAFYDSYIQEIESKREVSMSTIKQYKSNLVLLKKFKEKTNRESILLSDIDYNFIKDLDYYFRVEYKSVCGKSLKRNTINKYHVRFKSVLNMAVREGYIKTNPYDWHSFKNKKTLRKHLSKEEVKKIEIMDLSKRKSLERVRDLFLFSCYTGLRFSDAQSLTEINVKSLENNQKYLDFEIQKTSENIKIPLTEKALSIINRYSMNENQKNKARILPRISNQKFNIHIKTIAKMSALEKSISHHTARHTFATIALNNGIPITVVQKLLGHSSVKTTEIYAKTLTSTIFNEMEKME